MVVLHPLVSPLFVPAGQPERIAKAAASGADAIIVDLEDSVPPREKDRARAGLNDLISGLPVPVLLRVNARETEWHVNDVKFAASVPIAGLVLPKTECADDIRDVMRLTGNGISIVGLIETAIGLANLPEIVQPSALSQLAFGSIDFALDLNCEHSRAALAHARAEIVLRSRVAGLPSPVDGVAPDISDLIALADDCTYAAGLGFGGKLAIHPTQIETILNGFAPSEDMLTWARKVVQADLEADGAATRLDGQMIDRPMVERARRILHAIVE